MTGKSKKMNYPEIYLIRVDRELKKKLKKMGTKKVRKHLKDIHYTTGPLKSKY